MNFKLALAAAAVVGLAGTAQAADLAKKAPAAANYVKICDAYGAGYFYIPGSDTCLKIGGYVRAEVRTGNAGSYYAGGLGTMLVSGMNQSQRGGNGVYTRARANINFDTRTSTEYGLLRTYVEFWLTNSSGQTGNTVETNLRQAFVQFGGLTAGRATSFFDFVEGSYNIGNIEQDSSDHRANLLGYTFAFGNGITASAAIQDQSTVDAPVDYAAYASQVGVNPNAPAGSTNATYGGVKYPDLVANVNITQAWGRAQVMGALHDDYTLAHGDKWGYAVGAGVEVNLPMLAAGDKAFVQGMYTSGATSYALVNPVGTLSNAAGFAMFQTRDFWAQSATSVKLTTAWSVSGGFHHEFTKMWEANLGASYAAVDQFGAQDYNQIIVGGDLRWKPVSGFYIAAALDYYDLNFTSATKGAYNAVTTGGSSGLHDTSAWLGTIRVQRSF